MMSYTMDCPEALMPYSLLRKRSGGEEGGN